MFSDSDSSLICYASIGGFAAILLMFLYKHLVTKQSWYFTIREMLLFVTCLSLFLATTAYWEQRIMHVRRAREAIHQIGGGFGEIRWMQAYEVSLDKAKIGNRELDSIVPYLAELPPTDVSITGSSISRPHAEAVRNELPNCQFLLSSSLGKRTTP